MCLIYGFEHHKKKSWQKLDNGHLTEVKENWKELNAISLAISTNFSWKSSNQKKTEETFEGVTMRIVGGFDMDEEDSIQ